jgi:hypothetical protein
MVLSNLKTVNLTDASGGHTFNVTGWNHIGTLTNEGTTVDSLIAVKNAITLNGDSISSNDGMNLNLIGNISLNVSGNVNLSNWTGTGSFSGGTVTAVKNASFTLSNNQLTSTDGMSVNVNFATANLTDTGGGNSFTVTGWTGAGTFTNSGLTPDIINSTKNAGFTLGNGVLSSTDGMSLTFSTNITVANLTDTGGGHALTASGLTGDVNFVNSGVNPDAVTAVKNAGFTLTNSQLTSTDGMIVTMSGVKTANLTDTGSNHIFTVSNWTGAGTLVGTSTDAVIAIKNAGFTLGNSVLSGTDGMSLVLSGLRVADLTDTNGGNTFTVSGWSGSGILTGLSDTLVATKNANFTLSNSLLSSSDGMSLAFSGVKIANLTDTGGKHTFTVSGWTGDGVLTGLLTDTVIATKNASFILSNTSLSSSDGMSLTLNGGIHYADLTDTGGNNAFTVSGWTGDGVLTGLSTDTLIAAKNASFTLGNTSLYSTDGMDMSLSGIKIADLTDTGVSHTFNVTSWTGTGVLTGSLNESDIVYKNVPFTLMGNTLTATDGMSMTLVNILSSNVDR